MICETTLRVRTYECDSYQHVNNATYLNYLEYGRYEFLRDIGFDYPALVKAGCGIYIVRIEIDYKRPALADDVLRIRTWPVKKGAASGLIGQEIYRGGELIVRAKVTWAMVNSQGRPSRIPAGFDVPGLDPATNE